MPSLSYKERTSVSSLSNGKCGEVTFCYQVGKRFYALNCLFCPQICLQWDSFINHMEEVHDDIDHLKQKDPCDVDIVAKGRPAETCKEKIIVVNESENNVIITNEQSCDPLVVTQDASNFTAYSSIKSESLEIMDQYEGPGVSAERQDQTCSTYDDEVDIVSDVRHHDSYVEDDSGTKTATKSDIQALMDKLETSQKLIYRLLDGMKAIRYQTSCASNANIYKKVALLPIHPYSIKEEFLQFEEMLNSSDEQYTDFVAELKDRVSGNSVKFIKNCWRKLMVDDIAQGFCWQGSNVKMALKDLAVTHGIKRAYTEKYADHSDAEFEKCTITLFQQAKNRCNKKMLYRQITE